MSVKHNKILLLFIIVLGQHVSILIESTSDPSKKIDPYLEMDLFSWKGVKMILSESKHVALIQK